MTEGTRNAAFMACLALVLTTTAMAAGVPAFQTGPNSTVGTTYPGRIVLNDHNNPGNVPAVPCPDLDGQGNATAYTCRDIVRDASLGAPVLVREVASPDGEIFYQTLVGGECCAFDDNGINGEPAQLESFVRGSQSSGGVGIGSGIKLNQTLGSFSRALEVPTTATQTGSPANLPPDSGTFIFSGFADTRLDPAAQQDIDQQVLAPSFDDPFALVSVRISENANAFGGLYGNGDFQFAGTSDPDGQQLSSEVSVVTDYLLNSLDGLVWDPNLGQNVRSKWRSDIKDHQVFSFRSHSVYDASGNQTVTGSRTDITQQIHFILESSDYPANMIDANVNPDWDPAYGPIGTGASTQAVWDDYDMNFTHIISLTGDMIAAPADGGLGDGNPGITLAGQTLLWPAGTAGNNSERLTSVFNTQRLAFRRFVGDVQNHTSQTVTYLDGSGGEARVSQSSGARPQDMGDDNGLAVWDWDLAFAPIGAASPAAPQAPPRDPFLTTDVPDPFLEPTTPFCLPGDPNGTTGAC